MRHQAATAEAPTRDSTRRRRRRITVSIIRPLLWTENAGIAEDAIIGRKLKRQFNKASNFDDVDPFGATTATDLQSLGWFDVPGESVRQGERSTMLGYYRLLYNYGGDVYNAAMMYRAYGERFDEFGLRDMADHIEEFARFVTTAEGAVPITEALRAELLAKHRARLRRRDPYHNAPTYPAEE